MNRARLGRWAAPLGAGLLFFLVLSLALVLHFKFAEAGLALLVGQGFMAKPVVLFMIRFVLTLMLPFYLVAALALWVLSLALASAFRRGYSDTWTALEGFLLTLSALGWTHLYLWWQVPSTLWLLPGFRRLPFWLLLPLLLAVVLAYPLRWARGKGLGWPKASALVAGWLVLWSIPALAPEHLPRLLSPAKDGADQAKVVIIGLDALREDVGQAATRSWVGTAYSNSYTVIPATRLLWHILWGGDPLYYTVGHAPPAIEEYSGAPMLPLVDAAARQGWKPRFYIDDGGTIGLIGRHLAFDDVLMPAPGWENFVNSNLSASFPLFAAWENWGRAFPTTNPWAPLDAGLREALRLGRGSKWVMFHSCLAHVPIYPRREELARIPRWWTLCPYELEPYYVREQVTPARAAHYDIRRDPFHIYTYRMEAVLKAWEPIWNGLARDPQYQGATRILFSDHGERFYHVTSDIQLGGVHGYNLDPWETRNMLRMAGPGFDTPPGAPPRTDTISILSLRDAIARLLATGEPITPQEIERAYPVAPMRYQCVSLAYFTVEPAEYRLMQVESLIKGTGIAPGGIWFVRYQKPAEERAEDVTVAWGRGPHLEVVRPLKAGGAHRYIYDGFTLTAVNTISEDDYKAEKEKMKAALTAHSPAALLGM
jgi:hypothetical protein